MKEGGIVNGGKEGGIVNGVKEGGIVNGVKGGRELQRKGKVSREEGGRAIVKSEGREGEEDANEEEEGKDGRVMYALR